MEWVPVVIVVVVLTGLGIVTGQAIRLRKNLNTNDSPIVTQVASWISMAFSLKQTYATIYCAPLERGD